jgi:predicted nucleic acid-binding protein
MISPYKHYYLIDASAFGRYVDPRITSKKHDISKNIAKGYFYYIPQFCIAEIFNIFAKWRYRKEQGKTFINEKKYKSLRETFKTLIHDRASIYSYDLHRYHNLNCDKIYEIEHTTPKSSKKPYLSTFDILIIAMAIELQRIHGKDNITILTCDNRLIEIAKPLNIKTEFYC